jgi:hypothetical protein
MKKSGQASSWRLKAEELRVVAEQMKNSLARRTLERMAEGYDALAERAENVEWPPPLHNLLDRKGARPGRFRLLDETRRR